MVASRISVQFEKSILHEGKDAQPCSLLAWKNIVKVSLVQIHALLWHPQALTGDITSVMQARLEHEVMIGDEDPQIIQACPCLATL